MNTMKFYLNILAAVFLVAASDLRALEPSLGESASTLVSSLSFDTPLGINMVSQEHIASEQAKLAKSFRRLSFVRNGLTLSALSASALMFYWWSHDKIPSPEFADQQNFLTWFDGLDEDKKFKLLTDRIELLDSFSFKTLLRRAVPFAIHAATSSLITNTIQIILMRPLSAVVNDVYFKAELDWFVGNRTNIYDILNSLEYSAPFIHQKSGIAEKSIFVDSANDLIFQIERVLAFMDYQLNVLETPNSRARSIGIRSVARLKDIAGELVVHLNDSLCDSSKLSSSHHLSRFRQEFEEALKQFKIFESACN